MILPLMAAPSVFTPSPEDAGGAVEPPRANTGGSASHDGTHGRHAPDPVAPERPRPLDATERARGPFGTTWSPMADRLVQTRTAAESDAGPGFESAMKAGDHRRAARGALVAEALAQALQGRVIDTYAVDRPPGGAPEVVHVGPPVRIGTILDIVA